MHKRVECSQERFPEGNETTNVSPRGFFSVYIAGYAWQLKVKGRGEERDYKPVILEFSSAFAGFRKEVRGATEGCACRATSCH